MTQFAVVRVAVSAVVCAGALVGCSASAVEPVGLSGSGSASPTATDASAEAVAQAQDEAAVLDVFYRFWDAVVLAEQGNVDRTLFDGSATGAAVELQLRMAQDLVDLGVSKAGEPVFTQVVVEVDGDLATVSACVDNSGWLVPDVSVEGTDLVLPGARRVERIDGAWLVTDSAQPPADLTC